ncbi:MAG: sigma-70 family RNA polymerase sigma factor [Planctomycetaceae bacterium]|nr:sigma-70 family RNA polymerase sigma factor [Planctomycetaceae bacterium]
MSTSPASHSRIWPDQEPTKILLAKAGEGDKRAVNELLERHRDAVRKLIRMRLDQRIQRRVDVSDVLQDVLVEANRRLQDYITNPGMSFHLWLRQIAKDRMIDAFRRHRGSAKRSVDRELSLTAPRGNDQSSIMLAQRLQDHELTPATAAAQKEMAQKVEQAIGKLGEADYEIVVMRHYEQLSNREVAEALNLTEPAASMRYLRAIKRLRTLMEEDL